MDGPPETRARLRAARLYLICGARPCGRSLDQVLGPALRGGVDVFQLRDKTAGRGELRRAAERARALTTAAGALFIVNDDPAVAVEVEADGVHVGQRDDSPARAREIIGPRRLLGLSTHTPQEVEAAAGQGVDYIGVGPVHATPTKPGRPAVGVALVTHAARTAARPFFAIGGLNQVNAAEVLQAGARRLAVVRAIADAEDPEQAARDLIAVLDQYSPVPGPAERERTEAVGSGTA